jgi:hypothetical protein
MLSQTTIDEVKKVYNTDPEEVKRLAKSGDRFQRVMAKTILQVVGAVE